jgi:hypothetical protein
MAIELRRVLDQNVFSLSKGELICHRLFDTPDRTIISIYGMCQIGPGFKKACEKPPERFCAFVSRLVRKTDQELDDLVSAEPIIRKLDRLLLFDSSPFGRSPTQVDYRISTMITSLQRDSVM